MLPQCLALIVAAALAQEPQDPPGVRAREILSAPGYQTELPGVSDAPSGQGGGRRGQRRRGRPEGDANGGLPGSRATISTFDSGGAGFVLWIMLGIGGVVAVFWLLNTGRGHHRNIEVRAALGRPQPTAPAAAFAAPALDRVDELAGAGRFGEAIRLLLLLTFDALRGSHTGLTADASLTSRELVARTRLPRDSLTSLRALVDAVERSLFGRREPDEISYRACLREYEALLNATRSAS